MNYRSDFKKHLPSALWLFCGIAFLLFFTGRINLVLDKLLVKPFLSGFKNNLLNDLVLMTLSAGAATWLFLFGEKVFLRKLAVFTTFFYLLQLLQPEWQFMHMRLFPLFREWDLVVTALVLPACLTFMSKKPGGNVEINKAGFVEDLSIASEDQDTFRRKEVAREIAHRISITTNTKSFAIGILGDYGSGKTSFINLIKANIDKSRAEVVDFNPWSADRTPNIQKDFFDLLASRLYAMNPQVSGLILDYSRKLSRVDSSAEKFIRQVGFAGSLLRNGSYVDDYQRINKLLENSGKKIIVTIDDLDRLYKEEVMEVLRLIRNTASFTSIFYLVAYERGYIQESIKSMNSNVGSTYLDKIIQLEIPLPKRDTEKLLRLLEDLLKDFITEIHMEAYRSHILETGFRNQYNFAFEGIFRQSRDVIKFINNFKIAYQLLGKEVMFESLFVLELLKFRFPLIYDRLFERKNDFIREIPSRSTHEEFYELRTYRVEKEDLPLIGRTLREEKNYEEAEITLICGLLSNLFFKFNRSSREKNAIIYPMFFERYFRYRLSGRDISERQFQMAWQEGLTGIKRLADHCAEDKLLGELSTRVFQEKPDSRAGFELKVASLFYLGARYINDKGRKSFDIRALTDLLWNYDHNVDRKFYKNEEATYRSFLERIFEHAEKPYTFAADVIYNIKHDNKDVSIDTSKLVELQVRYFKEYVRENGLTKDAVWLFWGIRDEYNEPVPGKPGYVTKQWKFEPAIIPVIKEALKDHDPYEFLKLSIKYDMRDRDIVFIYPELLGIFEQPEEFREIVASNSLLPPEIKADYLAFFDACKAKDFKNWATYEFKTSIKPERSDND